MNIETERLILRPFEEKDAGDVLEYLGNPAVNCFACMKLASVEEARKEMQNRARDTEYYFAIVLKENDKVIGEIFAHPEGEDPEQRDFDTFSPCWMLNLDYTGKGYAYEAAYAYFDYLFREKGTRRIYAYTEDYNLSSQHLCERLGMRKEGLFLEFVSFINNPDGTPKYENTMQYAILKKEWDKNNERRETMTYEQIVEKVKKALAKVDASGVKGHLAVQVDVYGEGEGAFYIEVKDGKVDVQPYEYFDHDLRIRCTAGEIISIVEGKKKIIEEVAAQNIEALRNVARIDDFAELLSSPVAAKKTKVSVGAKKAGAEKKTIAKKAEPKVKEKKEAKPKKENKAKAEPKKPKAEKPSKKEKPVKTTEIK